MSPHRRAEVLHRLEEAIADQQAMIDRLAAARKAQEDAADELNEAIRLLREATNGGS